jgi:hypothetical protein
MGTVRAQTRKMPSAPHTCQANSRDVISLPECQSVSASHHYQTDIHNYTMDVLADSEIQFTVDVLPQ